MNKFVDVSHVYLVNRIDRILAQVVSGEKSLPKRIIPSGHFLPT